MGRLAATTRGALLTLAWSVVLLATSPVWAQPPGACTTPASQRTSEIGCYLTATQVLGALPAGPVFWHLYQYPTQREAEAAKGSQGLVVEAFGKVWLYTLAAADWRLASGERIAVVGPLAISAGKPYTARYMEAVFTPGMRSSVHRHSGPEAWYVLAGAQCLETPDGVIVARAGEGAVVPEGPPMRLSSVGTETRRSVLLVLHEAPQPWLSLTSDWTPKDLCPK